MTNNNNPIDWVCCGIATFLTIEQTNQIFQIISLVLTCIATLVTLGFNIYRWYKKATEDGKITEDEVKELTDEIKDAADEINKENK